LVKITIICNYAILYYRKLKQFSKVEEEKVPLNIPITDKKEIDDKIKMLANDENDSVEKFEKYWEIEAYLNSTQFSK